MVEENQDYLDYIKKVVEYMIENILDKHMEQFFGTMFEDVRHKWSMIRLRSFAEPEILKQSNFMDDEVNKVTNLALEKMYSQRISRKNVAVSFMEKYLLFFE